MDTKLQDFLTKQLFIEHNVVTFRSLSRRFNIHVNAAKNELATFYAASRSSPTPAYATYMLSGEVAQVDCAPLASQEEEEMDVDMATPEERDEDAEDDAETVPHTKVTLVGEKDLESAKAKYTRIFSEHVYSLSPSSLADAGLICEPSTQVYATDAKVPLKSSMLLGRIVGPHVHMGKPVPVASSSKASGSLSRNQTMPAKLAEKTEQDTKSKSKIEKSASLKMKASGTLDWSKARQKPKEEPKDEKFTQKETKVEKSPTANEDKKPKTREEKSSKSIENKKVNSPVKEESDSEHEIMKTKFVAKTKEAAARTTSDRTSSIKAEAKRGTKRRSIFAQSSDSEPETETARMRTTPPTMNKPKGKKSPITSNDEEEARNLARLTIMRPAVSTARARRGVVISDDEDSDAPQHNNDYKSSAKSKSLRAMMDIDDDEVIKASRADSSSPAEVPTTPEPEAEDSEMVEESEQERVKAKPRRKKEKKVIPVGRNGLKKRRVMKSRSTTDEKGYFVTEDYSSYESVDEEGAEPEPAKPKAKKASKPKKFADPEEIERKQKSKLKPNAKISSAESTRSSNVKSSGDNVSIKGRKLVGSTRGGSQGNIMNFFGAK